MTDRLTDRLREQPWLHQPDETATAHAAFTVYLALGPSRTHEKTREALGRTKAGYVRVLEKWSAANDWVARAAAFDGFELDAKLDGRTRAREVARQMYVDALPALVDLELRYLMDTPAEKRDGNWLRMLRDAIDRAGVSAPKRVELTGAEGGAIALSNADQANALDSLSDEELWCLVDMVRGEAGEEGH